MSKGMLTIRFKKGNPDLLECRRPDGSSTWQNIRQGMLVHDLAHYTVETELEFKNAFYGLLACGWSIEDFEKPKASRPTALWPQNLPEEALITEHIVNIVLTGLQPASDSTALLAALKSILKDNKLEWTKALTLENFSKIQDRLTDYINKWKSLKDGESLELAFPVTL